MHIGTMTIAVVFVLSLASCGAQPPVPEIPVAEIVWPEPPAAPRIRYVGSFAGPHDLGITKSFFKRVIEAIIGRTEEYMIRPTGVVERNDTLYVADPGAQALWIFKVSERRYIKVRQLGDIALVSPVAVTAKSDAEFYVADSWNGRIYLIDKEGRLIRVFAENNLKRPAALAFDANRQRLYVADSGAHLIAVFDANGTRIQTIGKRGSREGEFNYPTHLTLDRNGTLLVTDALNYRIQAFDRDGKFLWKFGRHGDGSGDVASPKGVAVDSKGHVYVVDALFDAVQIFQREGKYLLGFGSRGSARGQFWLPSGIFINSADRIYVADAYNQRIQIFNFIGEGQ
jgi:DNA-binding beta-propeller fold protein YncE